APIGADALRIARAHIKWVAFGECRADSWVGPPPTAAEAVAAIDAALASAAPAGQPGAAYADPYGWDCAGTLVRTRNTMESYRADGVVPVPLFADSGASRGQAPAPAAVAGDPSWEALYYAWRKVGADVVGLDWGAFTHAVHYAPTTQEAPAAVAVPDGWKHDCAALLTNDVELWVDSCPHCGKPRAA